MIQHETVGMLRVLQQRRILQAQIGAGEEPQDAAVENAALYRFLIQLQIKIQKAVIAAEFVVGKALPEGNDTLLEFLTELVLPLLHSLLPLVYA